MQEEQERRKSLLKLDLQTFAGDPDPADPVDPAPPADPQDPGKPDPKPAEPMIPKSRFDEINKSYKAMQKQLDELLGKQKTDEEEAAKKRGEFESLYTAAKADLDGYKSKAEQNEGRVKELETLFGTMLEAKLATIPEELHDLIPENLTPEAKLAWIEKASAKGVFGTKKADEPVGGPSNPRTPPAPDVSKLNAFQLLKAGYGSK